MKPAIFGIIALSACAAPTDMNLEQVPASFDESRVVHPAIVRVTVTPENATAFPAGTVQYVATALDGDGRLLRASAWKWSTSDTNVVVVSLTGLATARAPGQGVVKATAYPPWRR